MLGWNRRAVLFFNDGKWTPRTYVPAYARRYPFCMARVTAGDAVAMAEATPARGDGTRLTLRTDHPVFAAFAAEFHAKNLSFVNDTDEAAATGGLQAVALDAGILVGEILDVMDNGMPVAITDISATCHM